MVETARHYVKMNPILNKIFQKQKLKIQYVCWFETKAPTKLYSNCLFHRKTVDVEKDKPLHRSGKRVKEKTEKRP